MTTGIVKACGRPMYSGRVVARRSSLKLEIFNHAFVAAQRESLRIMRISANARGTRNLAIVIAWPETLNPKSARFSPKFEINPFLPKIRICSYLPGHFLQRLPSLNFLQHFFFLPSFSKRVVQRVQSPLQVFSKGVWYLSGCMNRLFAAQGRAPGIERL